MHRHATSGQDEAHPKTAEGDRAPKGEELGRIEFGRGGN